MTKITRVHAREVFDSRGRPTVEVEISCGERTARAIVPSGASTGKFESLELRDREDARLDGTGVGRAVENVRGEIARALVGLDAAEQERIDQRLRELDGTENKSRLGANAILGASLATAYAAATARGLLPVEHLHEVWKRVASKGRGASASRTAGLADQFVLPLPMVNMISGGLHAGGNLDFQDFLAVPVGAKSYRQALEWIVTIYRRLGQVLLKTGHEGYLVGDEGGYGPRLDSNSDAVKCLMVAIEAAGLRPGEDVAIGLDVASSHFYEDGVYRLTTGGENEMTSEEFVSLLTGWVDNYPIVSIEDGAAEDDDAGWKQLTAGLAHRVQLIGDDLFVTNPKRLADGIQAGVANSVLVKVNQIGTLWETLETVRLAIDNGYWPVISARSGETEDATIADLAVATGAGQIKIGSVARSERLAKYNQLLRLEEQLGDRAVWRGGAIFQSLRR
ncbi:MAG: phosphopyruvate hydratase [Planctomycetaceae bacterium]|nr:phosphopyruvate hydratase [Planctomycetaceae bacterium]